MPQTLKQMRATVLAELNRIPKGPAPQGELRMVYWILRMRSLGKRADRRKTAKEVLEESITSLKKDYPDIEFEYDQSFFNKVEE